MSWWDTDTGRKGLQVGVAGLVVGVVSVLVALIGADIGGSRTTPELTTNPELEAVPTESSMPPTASSETTTSVSVTSDLTTTVSVAPDPTLLLIESREVVSDPGSTEIGGEARLANIGLACEALWKYGLPADAATVTLSVGLTDQSPLDVPSTIELWTDGVLLSAVKVEFGDVESLTIPVLGRRQLEIHTGNYFTGCADAQIGIFDVVTTLAADHPAAERSQLVADTNQMELAGASTIDRQPRLEVVDVAGLERAPAMVHWHAKCVSTNPSTWEYNIGKDWEQFTASVGLEDDQSTSDAYVRFWLEVDGTEVAHHDLRLGSPASFDIDVTNALRLSLHTRELEHSCGTVSGAVWWDAYLSRS